MKYTSMVNDVGLRGQGPATTILKWNGAGGETMIWSDGCDEAIIGRLTVWDVDLLKILRDNGTYDIEITRRDGVQLLTDQVITDGTFTIPTSLSPLMKVVTTRKP